MKHLVLAVSGASGAIYARQLLDFFATHRDAVSLEVIASVNGRAIFQSECGKSLKDYPFPLYDAANHFAPCASGSVRRDAMAIAPCSMGTLGRIRAGTSEDLIARTADVFLKERRPLILVPRESPWHALHFEHAHALALAGATIIPASPSFYTNPKTIEELALTVTTRILDHLGFDHPEVKRWKD